MTKEHIEIKMAITKNYNYLQFVTGIKPEYEEYRGDDPLRYIISLNLHRRHLSESQRAVVASRLANMQVGNFSKSANLPISISQPEAAKMLNVSERTIRSVKAIERDAPELIPEIEKGKITVHKAEKEIRTREIATERKKIATAGEHIPKSEKWNIYHGDIASW